MLTALLCHCWLKLTLFIHIHQARVYRAHIVFMREEDGDWHLDSTSLELEAALSKARGPLKSSFRGQAILNASLLIKITC